MEAELLKQLRRQRQGLAFHASQDRIRYNKVGMKRQIRLHASELKAAMASTPRTLVLGGTKQKMHRSKVGTMSHVFCAVTDFCRY